MRILTGPFAEFRGTVRDADQVSVRVVVRWMGEIRLAEFDPDDIELLVGDAGDDDLPG